MLDIFERITYFKNAHLMMPYLIYVDGDIYGITERVKEIDPSYFVMFNPRTQQYELHSWEQEDGTLCLNLPFDELDSRTLERAQKHRVENIEKIMSEMEANNARIEREKEEKARNVTTEITKDIYTYCNRHAREETVDAKAFTTRFV
jgi:hypothetical protein